jgi:hypothetical protein
VVGLATPAVARTPLEPGQRPDVVDVQDVDVQREAPPVDAVDPALAWRAQNPYDSWPEHFGWTRIEPIPASVVAVTGSAVLVVVIALGALYLVRRRRRRTPVAA